MSDLTASRTDLERERDQANARLAQVEAEIEAIKSEMAQRLSSIQADAQRLRTTIGQIDGELARRETRDAVVPTISDHALLRYIERVHGIDVEAMKAELLTDSLSLAIKAGAVSVRLAEGSWVIKGSTVVTFKSNDMAKPKRRARGLGQQHDFDDEEAA